ncbi:MAG: type II toxin-antitoxin system death-on-curing family toxin [Rhodobacteraceae bacterium]|nr:type II toxin-antitoxin system death-on-curing family toxin [Paracoccaceae bacterium]MCY4249308.1 type II toxin-antitoxin system death-on-curing family toxin [Paracoccaceae bacterium]
MRNYRVTLADALCCHAQALRYSGGAEGIRDENSLESALARPYHGYHHRIHQKSAALVHGVVKNHGFVDGNKRTAFCLVRLLAIRSGYEIVATQEEIEAMLIGVAENRTDNIELVDWFRVHLQRP